jgi:hypothetical protein
MPQYTLANIIPMNDVPEPFWACAPLDCIDFPIDPCDCFTICHTLNLLSDLVTV